MLRFHIGKSSVSRYSRLLPIWINVGNVGAIAGRSNLHGLLHRYSSLSTVDPITISNDRQKITVRWKDGREVTQPFSPTPKVKSEKLAASLASLLSAPDLDPTTKISSFGTFQWQLDPLGDAIHRHVALSSPDECGKIEKLIMEEAETIHHHPHIARVRLSGRDTRLATKINELLAGVEVTCPFKAAGADQDMERLYEQVTARRKQGIDMNRQKIMEALESCGCENAKS
ncbi:hypothetical protein LTR20_009365 [Exophiala xenobiotica]|nr:hypothetical protein LTS13_009786 [Exophiala xenobiotica]KAK5393203.1 hypothetical protein LTR79_009517 [Exophiala xenobiotica]KAK5408165.1 hypothetical protein LTR90_009621 [Exophiala xenobiotica]KAK5456424.1 hypothetical protein LTR20_009365 [Exophiala xenobiotica]KAK5472326.1 hypothetical protein LTR26_010452 [Exophiala xenobiotica]